MHTYRTAEGETFMVIRVKRNVKGKLRVNARYRVKTGESALCHISALPLRTPSIISLRFSPNAPIQLSGSLCSFNAQVSSLTSEQNRILLNYPASCQEPTCPPGTPQVKCLVDPCTTATCAGYDTAVCRADYCGGCNARFYVDGKEVTCNTAPSTPSGSNTCPSGVNPVQCLVNPCTNLRCAGNPMASCVPDYCGECSARFYDKAGREVSCEINGMCPDGSPGVRCLADPCTVNKCAAYPKATCVSDYCGGCNASFYVDGKLVAC
eukprot:comp21205_c1_seq1/m.28821 comp21205_c1_seq1/g.28821  ORF comp21205_c1_seq1/g.28821 comp21205_c1_seq1/m.28821 type:complete len:265 (-) comp21205_c1_seq1:343-1137(-)